MCWKGSSRVTRLRRLGIDPNSPNYRRLYRDRAATREHLKRRAEGGTSELENIALACYACNQARKETLALLYLSLKRITPRAPSAIEPKPQDQTADI